MPDREFGQLSWLSAIIDLTADEFTGYDDAHGVAGGTLDGLYEIRCSLLHVKPNAVPVRAFDPFLKDFRVPGHVHSFIMDDVDVFPEPWHHQKGMALEAGSIYWSIGCQTRGQPS